MRHAVFVVLVLVPLSLASWIGWRGRHAPAASLMASAAISSDHAPHGPSPNHGGIRAGAADAPLAALFAGALAGAKVKDKVAFYDEKGLFDYIDGAAPLYIDRHFRKLAAAEMASSNGGEFTCDVYDMAEPENAAAIFFAERSNASKPVEDWPQATTGPMSFIFRSGQYYVKLTAFDKKAEAVLPEIARTLRERMRG